MWRQDETELIPPLFALIHPRDFSLFLANLSPLFLRAVLFPFRSRTLFGRFARRSLLLLAATEAGVLLRFEKLPVHVFPIPEKPASDTVSDDGFSALTEITVDLLFNTLKKF